MGLLRTAPDALRADFRSRYGISLRDAIAADWEEAADMAAHIPADGSSAVYRAMNPDTWRWGIPEHLAAMQVDLLRWLQWSKTKDATRKPPRNMPKPIPRPGVEEKQKAANDRFKDVEAVPLDELKRRLAKPRKAIPGATTT